MNTYLSPNVEDDAESVIVDVVCLILNNWEEPQFNRYTLGTTISELCANSEDTSKLERWLCNDKSSSFGFSEKDLIIEDSTMKEYSDEEIITLFDKVDESYQMFLIVETKDVDSEDLSLSKDEMDSLFNDIINELTK